MWLDIGWMCRVRFPSEEETTIRPDARSIQPLIHWIPEVISPSSSQDLEYAKRYHYAPYTAARGDAKHKGKFTS